MCTYICRFVIPMRKISYTVPPTLDGSSVAAVLRSVLRYAGVQAVLDGVRPCVVAMILATAVTMGLSTLGGYTAGPAGGFAPDGRAIAVFVLLGLVHCGYKKIRQKAPSPIGMILLSAVLGIVFWH